MAGAVGDGCGAAPGALGALAAFGAPPGGAGVPQPPRSWPRISTAAAAVAEAEALEWRLTGRRSMWVIYLEAAGILALLIVLVWWTMKGRK